MNDLVLSGLLNLFALFGAVAGIDKEKSEKLIKAYLNQHFGIRRQETYLGLYRDLGELYRMSPDLDKDKIIESVCEGLRKNIEAKEQSLLLLRFMEFAGINREGFLAHEDLFKKVGAQFNVNQEVFTHFKAFVLNQETEKVLSFAPEGWNGILQVIDLPGANVMAFTYRGTDPVMMNDVPVLAGTFQLWQQSGVMKGKQGIPLYYSNIKTLFDKKGEKHVPIELSGRDINFRFPGSDNGMHNFSFNLHSGQLVAIMGGSGVGKSTLLGLLNGNIKPQEGQILLNGHSIDNAQVQKLIGFVPQDDLLIEELTVYKNLWYTAKLCFDGMSAEEMDKRVMDVLTDLGLAGAKDLKVGSPLNKTISGGQRKRLNIALELIREPVVLFLDEPTSGLSSSDSEKVINLLKEQTFKGRLVVVNIHQPSSDIYKLFDKLWLLDKGGYPVYDGNPIEAITYFKNTAHYADADTSMCSACGNVNPEIVLNILDSKALDDTGKLTDTRRISPQEWHNKYLETRSEVETPIKSEVPRTRQKKPSAWKQFRIFLQRNIRTKLANTQYLLISLLEAPLLAVVVAMLTRYAPETGYTLMDNKNLVSYFFMAIIVAIFMGMSVSAEEIFKDRSLLKRERFLKLSHSGYIWSKIIYLTGLSLVQTLLFILAGNAIMGIHGMLGIWWIVLFASALVANLTGLVLSQSLSSIVAIYITIPLLLIPQILLCGLVVKFDDLNPRSKTGNVPVIGEVIPSRWAFEALAVSSFEYNNYMKHFFDDEKEKFRAQYYRIGFLEELQSQKETAQAEYLKEGAPEKERLEIIKTGLPQLARITEQDPLQIEGSAWSEAIYKDLDVYFSDAGKVLSKRSLHYTREIDRTNMRMIQEIGKDGLLSLKKNSHNLFLQDLVLNTSSSKMFRIVDNTIVPKVGQIYLEPATNNGRAPFYSHEKILGKLKIPTLWYNLGVLGIMAVLTALALFFRIPARFMGKKGE
ncbi:MAG TPA: ATP-binding cassette domain-containing protein [Bacteroidales bacterium]|nr:ATP-binding cassette domain-containing protein [Bacteroidales bacterium]